MKFEQLPIGPIAACNRFSADVKGVAEQVFGTAGEEVLEALAKPVSTYFVRCNTLKTSPEELRRNLESLGFQVIQNPMVPEALGIQTHGPFEVLADNQKVVVVDKHTAESCLQGANVYAPGILECGSMSIGDDVTIVSEFGELIARGQAIMSANEVLTFRKGLAIRNEKSRYVGPHIRDLSEFSNGFLYPQSLAAMATSRVLDPKPGETIVDINCAPGGKLSHISQLTNNSGKIFGFDRNPEKIRQARQTVSILGCRNVVLSIHDTRYLSEDIGDLKADRVLVDPPCSALGLRPKIYDFTTLERIAGLADYQKQFIKAASKITKPGGVIVYSVCTFTPQECEEVVNFAEHECDLTVTRQDLRLASPGLQEYGASASLCQRFSPLTQEIGYFIAKFKR